MNEPPLRLRAGVPVVDRGAGHVQLGTDPRWSTVLAGLAPGEVRWLCEAAVRSHVPLARAARRHGLSDERRAQLEQVLARGGFLVAPDDAGSRHASAGRFAADAAVLGSLRLDGAGTRTLAVRARATVGVAGLGRIGAALAGHLATAGVGALALDDDLPVQITDLGLGGYEQTDIGRPRRRALAERLAARHPPTVGGAPRDDAAPDVVVVVEQHVATPGRFERLLGSGIAHLSVVVREADVVVGPLVLPGRSACLGCVDLRHADEDPGWPTVAASLRRGPVPPAYQEASLSAGAAALAAGQVLALLDGSTPVTTGGMLELTLPEAVPRLREVTPHPACPCVRLPAAPTTPPPGSTGEGPPVTVR